jgi:neutral ceramidase
VLTVFSADIPGAMSRYVENAFNDNIIVAYSQGAQGDQNPLYLRPSTNAMASRDGKKITGYELNREEFEGPLRFVGNPGSIVPKPVDPKVLDNLFRFIESEGQILGEEVIRIMTVTKNVTGNVYIKGQEKVVTCPGRKRLNGDSWDPSTRAGVAGVYKDAPDVHIHLGVLGLGTTAILRSDGEVFSYIGQQAKKEAPLAFNMFVGIANGIGSGPGYIPNDGAYGEQTFQVLNTPFKPGCAERGIVNALVELTDEYLHK